MKRAKKQKKIPYRGLIVIVLVILGVWLFFPRTNTTLGLEYIQKQEKLSVDSVSSELAKLRKEEMRKAQDAGTLNPFSLFRDYVIFGDSRVMGFSSYGYLESSRVLAGTGHTINNIPDWQDNVKTIRPSNVYFSYGVNDMGLDIDSQEGGYDGVYEGHIKKVLKNCPKDANVYVNSILPATEEAVKKSPAWNQVKKYNKKIKKMCEKNGWTYIDNDEITDNGKADIYQPDGIHFASSFYPTWALRMNEGD